MEKKSQKVVLENIVKEYVSPDKKVFRAVDNISLEIHAGEFVTLLGPSGCGKTTTLRMIAGFEKPTSGSIFLGDQCINHLTPDKRDTAMVFQSYALFPHNDVYNNISFGLRLKGMNEAEITEKVNKIMDLVGLEGLGARFPNQLSGGQQQRVALARALVVEPSVMLFDEPLSNLDAKLRISMRSEIKKIQRRLGLTSIYVTHDQTEAMALSDRIIVMNQGNIEQIGTPQDIYYRPASKFVADFIGRSNFFNCKVLSCSAQQITVDMFGAPVGIANHSSKAYAVGSTVTVMARPEIMLIGSEGIFQAKVVASTFLGSMQEYLIQIGNETYTLEDHDFAAHTTFTEGDTVRISFKPNTLHII